jgi:excisionase family DNA binding protein
MQLNNNPHPLQPRHDSYEENLLHLQTSSPDKILFDMIEVAKLLSVSYEYVRQLVSNGVISSIKMGRRRLVTGQS